MQNLDMGNPKEVDLYSKAYTQFRGVDFSTDSTQVDSTRSPASQNIISDLKGFPEKRAGWRYLHLCGKVHSFFYAVFADGFSARFAHIGKKVYKWDDNNAPTEAFGDIADADSVTFVHKGILYLLDGSYYWSIKHDTDGYHLSKVSEDDPYIPTLRISITGNETVQIGTSDKYFGGHTYEECEEANILTPKRKCTMVGDAASTIFYLPEKDVDSVDIVSVNGIAKTIDTDFTVDLNDGKLTFTSAPDADPDGVGLANIEVEYTCMPKIREEKDFEGDGSSVDFEVEDDDFNGISVVSVDGTVKALTTDYTVSDNTITFLSAPANESKIHVIYTKKDYEKYAERINKCTIAESYGYYNDNRFFLSGEENEKYQNCDYMSGTDDPTYFPYDGWVRVGADTSKIMGYLKQYDSMLVLKNDNEQDAQVFCRAASYDNDDGTLFPVKQGIKGVGAVSKYGMQILRDDPLFLAKEGVFSITAQDVKEQRGLQDRSFYVETRLSKEPNLENAISCVFNNYFILCVNNRCYVADARQQTGEAKTEQYGYEWYYWTNIPAKKFFPYDGCLYFYGVQPQYTHIQYVPGTDFYPIPVNCQNNGVLVVNGIAQEDSSWEIMGDMFYFHDTYSEDDVIEIQWEKSGICKFNTDIDTVDKFADGAYGDYEGEAIEAIWSTKADTLGTIINLKNIQKKGCAIMIKPYTHSSIEIGYMTNREGNRVIKTELADVLDFSDIDFSRITFNTLDLPMVIPINRKIKKFNILQIILRSCDIHEGFGCYGIQLTYTMGRYVK